MEYEVVKVKYLKCFDNFNSGFYFIQWTGMAQGCLKAGWTCRLPTTLKT